MKYPKELTEAIERSSKAVEVYYERGHSMTLDELHTTQDRLSTLLFYIGEQEAHMKSAYNFTRFKREISFSRSKMSFRDSGYNGGDSDAKANQAVENDKMQELNEESMAYRLQNLVKRSDKILSAISQRITTLRGEKEYERKVNRT